MAFHKNLSGDSIHVIHTYTYANSAARLAATGFVSADVGKVAKQTDNNTYYILTDESPVTWQQIGSGAGSGGINFVGLDSNFAPANSDDRDAENSVGNWVAYADAAAAVPVDMTGGSPNVTITRTTTGGEVLNGSASFKITKDAANRQGQGVSVVANVPVGYRTSLCKISVPFKVVSGSLPAGALKMFIYDVTNSQLITPFSNDVAGSQGVVSATFQPNFDTAQIRVGFHFASTSTSAVTLSFDDVTVGPAVATPIGLAGTDWTEFTPTGSWDNTTYSGYYRQVGDSVEMIVYLLGTGTPTTTPLTIDLPNSMLLETSKIPGFVANRGPELGRGSVEDTNPFGLCALYNSDSSVALWYESTTSSARTAVSPAGNPINFTTGSKLWIKTDLLPIKGLTSNLSLSSSSRFLLSNYLANGTRVTGVAPAQLGEYRSYLRNSSATTYTETNGTPAILPTVADGIFIYNTGSWATPDASNEPTRYEFFVGRNKVIRPIFWENAGRTDVIDGNPDTLSAANIKGYEMNYDPNTGILKVNPPIGAVGGGLSIHYSGLNEGGGVQDCYFDVEVSENVVGVGQELPQYWNGYHDATYDWNTTSTSFVDATNTAVGTFTERANEGFGQVATAASNLPGITFTPASEHAVYEVAVNVGAYNNTAGGFVALRLMAGTTELAMGHMQADNNQGKVMIPLKGFYKPNSTAAVTLKLEILTYTGTTGSIQGVAGASAIEWNVLRIK